MLPSANRKNQRWLRVTILVIGSFTLLCFLLADPVLRTLRKRDQIGAVTRQGIAIVATLTQPHANVNGEPTPALVTVRFQNGIYTVANVYNAEHLQIGQPAQIEYRTGKSGAVYVDVARPLTH